MAKQACILRIFILVLLSCNVKQNKISKFTVSDSVPKEKTIRYYEDSSVKGSRQEPYVKNLGKLMGLPSVANAKEGLYIRIWIWGDEKNYVVDISDDLKKKECFITEFNGSKADSTDYIVIDKEWKDLMPKSGSVNFFNTLEKYQIPYMESGKIQEERKGFLTMMAYVQFEIARPNEYRYYEYLEPSYYRYVDTGSNNVYRFLEFLNAEMVIQIYNPAKNYL